MILSHYYIILIIVIIIILLYHKWWLSADENYFQNLDIVILWSAIIIILPTIESIQMRPNSTQFASAS